MRSLLGAFALALTVTPALAAGGGMGDPSVVLREKNAICDRQRRGELPPEPSYCLPELPVGPVYEERGRRMNRP